MKNEELLNKMNRIKTNLNNAKIDINKAKEILSECISIDGEVFCNEKFSNIENKINVQLNNLNNKIIPKIKSM